MQLLDIVIVVDRSTSTESFIDNLNRELNDLLGIIKYNAEYDCYERYVSIIPFPTFSDENFDKFVGIPSAKIPDDIRDKLFIELTPRGATDPTAALKKAISYINEGWEESIDKGEQRAVSLLVYLTDGKPNAGASNANDFVDPVKQQKLMDNYEAVGKVIRQLEDEQKVFFIGCGFSSQKEKADIETICMLTNFKTHVIDFTDTEDSTLAIRRLFSGILPSSICTLPDYAIANEMLENYHDSDY